MPDLPQPPDMTAAELALGLLDGPDRAAALRRVLADPGFAADVETWRSYFAQMFDLWPEAQPGDHVAERIEASLDGTPVSAVRHFPWPALAIFTSAIAACLLLFVVLRPAPPAPISQPVPVAQAPLLVATLDAKDAPVAAVFDATAGSLRIAAAPGVPDRRVAQLWVIGGDGVPHAIGLLGGSPAVLTLPPVERSRLVGGAVLAISVEPLGGSPTGLPTGPVIAKGALARV